MQSHSTSTKLKAMTTKARKWN